MKSSVKTVFKVLIGTIVVLIVASLVTEVFNITMTSLQMSQVAGMAARASCNLFGQETYKNRGEGGAKQVYNVVSADGQVYVEGKFYDGVGEEAIYNSLYAGSSEFWAWCKSDVIDGEGNWHNLQVLAKGMSGDEIEDKEEQAVANSYLNVKMTPLNLGIPYMDQKVLERMFKWNLAQLMSNCNPALIQEDINGDYFVNYKGFRIYADQAEIVDLEYRVFDISGPGRVAFKSYTGISPESLGISYNSEEMLGKAEDRSRVCLVGVTYTIPIAYEGITPLKQLVSSVYNGGVEGLNQSYGPTNGSFNNVQKREYTAGGFSDSSVSDVELPVSGQLIYFVIA